MEQRRAVVTGELMPPLKCLMSPSHWYSTEYRGSFCLCLIFIVTICIYVCYLPPRLLSDLNFCSLSRDLSVSQNIPDDRSTHAKHPINIFSAKLYLTTCAVLPWLLMKSHCPHSRTLIRTVSRMDGLARTSLKPIRCTEREIAFHPWVVLYVIMTVRE